MSKENCNKLGFLLAFLSNFIIIYANDIECPNKNQNNYLNY